MVTMETRWPEAVWDPMTDAGKFLQGPFRGVLHTTEGSSYAGAKGTYVAKKVAPHFTVTVETGEFRAYQHVPLDKAARALANPPGGIQTNRIPCIQVEIVWKAAQAAEMTDTLLEGLRRLMTWVEAQVGIKPWAPPFVGNEGYGLTSVSRMKPETWLVFDGWCGHQHVPENAHWDPGRIPIEQLLERSPDVADEIHLNHPPRLILATPTGKGYWVAAYDGGMFAFGDALADSRWTAIGGGAVEKIISGTVFGVPSDPASWGAWLMGEDGGVFSLGAAQFMGRTFYP